MDWSAIGSLLGCDAGIPLFRALAIVLGGIASLTTIIAAVYHFCRWWRGPNPTQRRAAKALREQGWYRHRLKHRAAAMELYNYSIRLNPRAGHTYYLRGCLREELGEPGKAKTDWERCLGRMPQHVQALQKLGVAQPATGLFSQGARFGTPPHVA